MPVYCVDSAAEPNQVSDIYRVGSFQFCAESRYTPVYYLPGTQEIAPAKAREQASLQTRHYYCAGENKFSHGSKKLWQFFHKGGKHGSIATVLHAPDLQSHSLSADKAGLDRDPYDSAHHGHLPRDVITFSKKAGYVQSYMVKVRLIPESQFKLATCKAPTIRGWQGLFVNQLYSVLQ